MRPRLATVIATIIALIIIAAVVFPYYTLLSCTSWYETWHEHRITQRELVSDAYARLKTGDVLLFISGNEMLAKNVVSRTYFSHVGTIVREGDLVYISEAQPGESIMPKINAAGVHRLKPGAALAPFLSRVKYYMGSVFLLRLSRPLAAPRAELLKRTAERLHVDGYPYPSGRQAITSFLFGGKVNARHCFQHTAHLLDVVGLTPNIATAGIRKTCQLVCALGGQALPDGYSYSQPIELVYDVDAQPAPAPAPAQ